MRAIGWVALLTLVGMAAAGCATAEKEPQAERFPYIQDRNFQMRDEGTPHTVATGIGCGGSEKEALTDARRTAHYNLRGVTGNADYKIRFTVLREVPKPGRICVEVEAAVVR